MAETSINLNDFIKTTKNRSLAESSEQEEEKETE